MNTKNDVACFMQPQQTNAQQGFTLAELMITIAILGILTALAAPSFSNQLASQRIKSSTTDFTSIIDEARSESIIRREDMKVEYDSTDNIITLLDQPEIVNGKTGRGKTVTQFTYDPKSTVTMVESGTAITSVTFRSNKTVTPAPVIIKICDSLNTSTEGRAINISSVGNVTVKGVSCS